MASDHIALEQRLARLEYSNRLFMVVTVIMSALLLLAFSRELPSSTDLVQARRIQLVDDAGHVRIDLRHDTTETGLFVLD